MTKVLVACADYPSDKGLELQFVHVRNKYYQQNGIDVTVLNFASKKSYSYENIKVVSLDDFYKGKESFKNSVLICHAPNLRNHFRFLKKNRDFFKKTLFFFHGHEIVKINDVYPSPYPFMRESAFKRILRAIYDCFKLKIWKHYFLKKDTKSPLIFVSESLKNDFIKYLKIPEKNITARTHIIHNAVSKVFEHESYKPSVDNKMYDFITIRDNLDSSVYCIDLVVEAAYQNPDKTFLIIGNGKYFNYNSKPENITLINHSMPQEELVPYINSSKIALMPTRRDSQGVMACELATFGIPVITSDLGVCKEMFGPFNNVKICDLIEMMKIVSLEWPIASIDKNVKFYSANTIAKEIQILKSVG